jgi:hypothetical protein
MLRILLPARLLPWLASVLVLLFATAAWAQNAGDIQGTVEDPDGIGIPGVTITLTNPAGVLGGDRVTETDPEGKFRFTEILAGSGYVVTATKGGFRSVTVTGIQVLVNQAAYANITMETGSEETITVEGKAKTVDVENVTRGEVLTKDFLQKIPTGRSYQSAVTMAAGVIGEGGNPNMAGSASNENTYMLDGVNITDPVTGTFSLNFNYDAIQQVEVLLGGYEPEYGVSLGGIINLVSESGTNNLEFDTSVFYTNGNWAPKMDARYSADGFQIAPTGFDSNFQTMEVNAKIAGPVIRDKAWFIFSYSAQRSLINNIGIELPRDFDGHYVLSKLTVQPNSEHRITTLLQLNPTTIDNTDQSTRTIKPEAQGRQAQGGYVTQLRWQWFLSPEANLDTQLVNQKTYIEVGGVPCTHDKDLGYHPCDPDEQENSVDWETPGRFGSNGAYDSVNWFYFLFDDRYRYQATSKLSVLAIKDPLGGTHDMKFGVEATQLVWDQVLGYAGHAYYVDLNEIAYDPNTFQNYYWVEATGPWSFRTTGSQWNWFAQDAYKPVSNLTIKYGIRYDNVTMRNDLGVPVLQTGLWGPRLYAAWDPFGDQKTKIGGGYGRFNDTARFEISDYTSESQFAFKLYLGELFNDPGSGQGFLNGSSLLYDIAPRTNPNTAIDDIRTPRVDEFVVLLQRELIEDVSIGSNLTNKRTRNLFEPDETNVIYDEDGSATIGSRNGNPLQNAMRLRSPTLARRDYVQADVYLDKVNSRRWFGRVTYSYAQSYGTSVQSLWGSFTNDPQTQYNYGLLYETDIRHQVKGYAAWSLPTDPWVQNIGAQFVYYSGQPFERRYWSDEYQSYSLRIRPRGVYDRLPGSWELGIRFAQDLDVRKGKLVLDFQVLNVFNNQQPSYIDSYWVSAEHRMFVLYRQDPLQMQLGLRYQF